MREWLRDHGLLITNLLLFVIFFGGMVLSGVRVYNSDQLEHGGQAVSLGSYLLTGDFYEATFENWESEFLQMGMYVVLTAYLFQRGSSESKSPDASAPQDEDPRKAAGRPDAPWPVRRGGWVLTAYENSLAGLFFILFFASVAGHAIGGAKAYSAEELAHGGQPVTRTAVPRHVAVLVRVLPELAERIPRSCGDRGRVGVPAATRVGRVQAGRRTAS